MRIVPLAVLASLSLSLVVVACGSDSNSTTDGNPGGGSGSGSGNGSGSGGNGTLTLSGIAKEISISGTSPLPGVAITAYNASDDSMIGSATSGSDGTFSISVTTSSAIDGYLKGTYGNYKLTYLYPPKPITANYANVPVYMLSTQTYDAANALLGNGGQGSGNGWIAMLVQDGSAAPVGGAAISSTPQGKIGYNGSNALPTTTGSGTGSDGIGYDVNVTAGSVMVSATKTGLTFQSHSIKVRAGVVTLTLVTE